MAIWSTFLPRLAKNAASNCNLWKMPVMTVQMSLCLKDDVLIKSNVMG